MIMKGIPVAASLEKQDSLVHKKQLVRISFSILEILLVLSIAFVILSGINVALDGNFLYNLRLNSAEDDLCRANGIPCAAARNANAIALCKQSSPYVDQATCDELNAAGLLTESPQFYGWISVVPYYAIDDFGYEQPIGVNRLKLESWKVHFELTRQGDELLLDGQPWPAKSGIERTDFFYPHPWLVWHMQLYNYSAYASKYDDFPWWFGCRFSIQKSPIKGSIVLLLLAALLLFVNYLRKTTFRNPALQ